MKISYNYIPLMREIKEEIEDGVLHPDDVIQIVRSDYDILGYRPIIDWYYGKKRDGGHENIHVTGRKREVSQ